ncbi:MAG: FAD/NAD(P)-binding oxidoreductase [Pyrobaculum arsenaticum]|uniref:FAD-dependent pyridine nucleotide-disulfide oxidoreductase n=2 Tax=Pyrobaculum arsenaticum TaxID=121277 RepID=A4WMU3_PYRAR|nr:FAD/NAD(P)-binding oxidoreductase [Pyrobaculum arsenaticum]ABP51710.1 FAD-dependent pyridine nucleotide-disulfide oxidoreductase [Pyrobaculum arsenaticum DSM 13514]MCY0890097.1 FAD/NAD(P)-binding oxidoreductase [Pyrobaculum arsenaticum]NYR16029.1 NAD(P)/FAD-dependent oxidoreductase [Pyrobaculum arsenaticum]
MTKVVVVGGGIAGIYFAYRLLQLVDARVVLIEPKENHEFVIGIPMAFGGLIDFDQLLFPLSQLRRVIHVRDNAKALDGKCVRLASMPSVCGDYVVLAPGAYKLGSVEYWNVEGAKKLWNNVEKAQSIHFIVNELNPVIGFQEIAYAIKTRFPEKRVSIHLVYVADDYRFLLNPWMTWAEAKGIEISEDPPQHRPGDLYISVPSVRPHPLVADLEPDPATMETQLERVYLIGDAALLKLGLPPIGWGALWQASLAAQAVASEITMGYIEVEPDIWSSMSDPEKFKNWLTYRMTSGTPLIHIKGLYDTWANKVVKTLS